MSKYSEIIEKMTLEEKCSLLSGKDFWNTREIKRLNIPNMSMADGPHGLRKQAKEGDHLGLVKGVDATCFPTSSTIANSWDADLCEEIGEALGREAAFHNVNIILGPGLNIKRGPLCGRNFEYFSEDPYLSGKLAAACTKGIQKRGVGACLKHFAANNQEHMRMTNDSIVDERTLHEIYLTGFEIAVKEGEPKAVMSSYNRINGIYANENKYLLRDILIDQWGFKGIVISDWGGSNDPIRGAKSGATLEMPTTGKDSVRILTKAIENGEINESDINERVEQYLNVLFNTQINEQTEIDYEQHHNLARKAAEESAVLLKNNNVLPLSDKCKVAIIGDFAQKARYQGAGSSMVSPYKLESTLEAIGQTNLEAIGYAQGYNRFGGNDDSKIVEAVQLAKKSDVAILYIGLSEVDEVEGNDRLNMMLPNNQIALIKAVSGVAKKTIAVISGGASIEMPWENCCDAIIHGYLAGQSGASAMLNILTGKVNPSGKLGESYPLCYEDCPNVRYYPGAEATSEYREGIYVGYRYFDKADVEVMYPFGYGLSYTSFEYSDLSVEKDCVWCKVTNTGNVAGSEVVQLYVGMKQEKVHRSKKELKGFCKIFLNPQETKQVKFYFDEFTFRYYDILDKKFIVQTGTYELLIGSSSRDIRLSSRVEINGIEGNSEDSDRLKKYFDGNVENITVEEFEALYGKPVPPSKWDRSKTLKINDSLSQMVYAKSPLARFAIKILLGLKERSFKNGKPNLNLCFLSSMPFRSIAKLSGGKFSMDMTKDVLTIVNGQFFRGVIKLIGSLFAYRKRERN